MLFRCSLFCVFLFVASVCGALREEKLCTTDFYGGTRGTNKTTLSRSLRNIHRLEWFFDKDHQGIIIPILSPGLETAISRQYVDKLGLKACPSIDISGSNGHFNKVVVYYGSRVRYFFLLQSALSLSLPRTQKKQRDDPFYEDGTKTKLWNHFGKPI